jgi:hypothetical protein
LAGVHGARTFTSRSDRGASGEQKRRDHAE